MSETPKGTAGTAGQEDALAAFREVFAEQRERQGRLRHVQQFLTSPQFLDMRDMPISVSDPPEVIEERKRDLDYRIRVLESVLALLIEERDLLDRTQSASGEAAGPGSASEPDPRG